MTERLSTIQWAVLKTVANGPILEQTWRKWDQRPIRALYIRSFLKIGRDNSLALTRDGWDLHSEIIRSKAKQRNTPKDPLFFQTASGVHLKVRAYDRPQQLRRQS